MRLRACGQELRAIGQVGLVAVARDTLVCQPFVQTFGNATFLTVDVNGNIASLLLLAMLMDVAIDLVLALNMSRTYGQTLAYAVIPTAVVVVVGAGAATVGWSRSRRRPSCRTSWCR